METINNGMCRCCASEGTFKDVATRYQWMGEEEVYGEMLRECFDITLAASDDGQEAGICEVCITQLRNAANFKKQVQRTEEQFKRRLDDLPFKSNIVKVEASPLEEAVGVSDDDDKYSDEMSLSEYQEIAIKTESSDDTKAKKRSAKATTSRAKQPKLEAETSSKRVRLTLKRTVKTERALKVVGGRKKSKDYSGQIPELAKHRINVRMILQHSNATPIRCRGGIGYACCFCTEQFPDPADLKTHNLECHHNDKAEFVKGKMMSAFLVKLDITALKCTVCNKSIDTLEELVDHLIKSHNKKLYTDIKSHILPFKFDGVLLKCIYCLQIFSKFKLILEHMNTHFRNYVCEVCDAGYVSRKILDTHVQGHKLGVFQCEFCEKVFDTSRKKKSHEKSVHIHSNFLYKCGYCNVKFSSSSKKEDHITKIHGVEAPRLEFNCRSCGEIFDRKRRFMMHIQRDHLMERRYACELCDMKFFISCDLKQHMLKHTGIKEFQCDVCLKSYGRKNTLKEHMRIHADDRRFKCGICDRAFVQKCSWKNHMRSKHKELVVN
ncbi:zinc finger protein 568-like isoform X3 [Ostrinia furnacalis]|uniref:zinc finger protein 568-like isoform X3 n=1 Tax=Ostrinia furnacalis TaxID=93504 RepID=UPI0010395056|nr:zinc finger protein 568-like isoform X3 [Ostrinia furnacalis]